MFFVDLTFNSISLQSPLTLRGKYLQSRSTSWRVARSATAHLWPHVSHDAGDVRVLLCPSLPRQSPGTLPDDLRRILTCHRARLQSTSICFPTTQRDPCDSSGDRRGYDTYKHLQNHPARRSESESL